MKRSHLFLLAVAIVLQALSLAAPASAAPPQCEARCTCSSSCLQPCSIGFSIANCGAWGDCRGMCLTAGAPAAKSEALLSAILTPSEGEPLPAAPAPAKR